MRSPRLVKKLRVRMLFREASLRDTLFDEDLQGERRRDEERRRREGPIPREKGKGEVEVAQRWRDISPRRRR